MSSPQNNNVILPKDLKIAWIDDPRYWRKPSNEEEPVELVEVCWLEVTGSCRVESGKTYEVGFQISMAQGASGWNGIPVSITAKIGEKGKRALRKVSLNTLDADKVEIPEQRITITAPQDDMLYFGMYEVRTRKWKSGLRIHAAFVREAI